MSRRQFPILPIIAMLAIIAGCYGLYKNIIFEEFEYEVEQSAQARKNRLLAAGFLLNTEGFDFEIKDNRRVFTELDQSVGVLWLTDSNELEDKREAEKIINWVESGGILLTSPSGQYGLDESTISGWLMDQFGIEEFDGNTDKNTEAQDKNDARAPGNSSISARKTITLPDTSLENAKIDIFSDYERYFQIAKEGPNKARTIIDTPFLIHRSVGEGYVAVYSDEELFDTDRIDEADQGYLLLWLTQPAQSKNVSMVFRPASSPGLFTMLWNKFTLAICLLGLALISFLRWAASRLGPIEQELPPIKNNIMAHLEARGEFWYRHKYTDKILANVQAAAQESVLARGGRMNVGTAIGADDKPALLKQASEQLRCSQEQADQILFGHAKGDSAILRTSRALQRLNHYKQYKSK